MFEWHDSETEAKGWVVINSLRGGTAGGGTRMRKGLDRHEAIFRDVSERIRGALQRVHNHRSRTTGIAATALELTLKELMGE